MIWNENNWNTMECAEAEVKTTLKWAEDAFVDDADDDDETAMR